MKNIGLILIFIAGIIFSGCAGNNLSVEEESNLEIVRLVNSSINRYPPKSDKENYGVEDYFASPEEFYSKGGGDCEDYSITKRSELIKKGINPDSIQFLLVKFDEEFHMILAVKISNKEFFLDNRTPLVLTENTLLNKMKYTKVDYYSYDYISKYIGKDKSPNKI